MRLTEAEERMLAGGEGEAVRRALQLQLAVGEFFGAADFVPIHSAHLMAEIESMGDAGLAFVEDLAALGARVRVPTTCNPRSVDFVRWEALGQERRQVEREARLSRALGAMDVLVVDTCINYQTIQPPLFGEHLAWGDTGTVIFANSVAGARSNFEGGPVALAAGITGRTPRYGYHLPEQRRGTVLVEVRDQPTTRADWSALGCAIGRQVRDYWQVPVITGIAGAPTGEELKHLGAALASYGSLALFHMVGVTPEARTVEEAFGGHPKTRLGAGAPPRRMVLEPGALAAIYRSFAPARARPDLVVFSAPQLSLLELRDLARALHGRRVHPEVRLIATTNYHNYAVAAYLGHVGVIEEAGGLVVAGACFYLLTPRELAERFGYHTIVTDSAKLANIIAGYDYHPVFRPTEVCIEAAIEGRLRW
ncbi:MAG TPA: aconitase X catalytic domain-containing protein [Thermomicrobiales bacterium]|nr:aconitase X catalytic domain-containing protein [Thermomicrobiales bacterium]